MAVELSTEEGKKLIALLKIAEEQGLSVDWKFIEAQNKYMIDFVAVSNEVESDIKFRLKGNKRERVSFVLLLNGTNIALARIDNVAHTNPDGTKLSGAHIHLYREGFADKWAYPIENFNFDDANDSFLKFLAQVNFDRKSIDFKGRLI